MIQLLAGLFSNPVVKAVEKIGSEWIETNQEKAEAQALMVKTLDPNGLMRRELSRFASIMYGFYLVVLSILTIMVSFGVGDAQGAVDAASMFKDLFTPITTAWGGIVAASFGVNGINSFKGR
jgi:hypothetical protein